MQTNRHIAAERFLRRIGVVVVTLLLTSPVVLWAHAHLRRSEPSAHDRLVTSPTAIRLWFSERPEIAFTRVRLRAADSSEIALGAPVRMTDDAMGLNLSIATSLSSGTYTVLWRTAAADGHASSGSFSFEVTASGAPRIAATDTQPQTTRSNAIVKVDSAVTAGAPSSTGAPTRWLEFMTMLAVIGAVIFRLVVIPRADREMGGALFAETHTEIADTARRLAQGALLLLIIVELSRFYGEVHALLGSDAPMNRGVLLSMLGTGWGTGWFIGIAGMLVAAIGLVLVRRWRDDAGWFVGAIGALVAGSSPALTGHARTTPPVGLAVATDVLHVIAACAWLGTLLTLLFTALPLVRGTRSMNGISSGTLVASLVRAFHPVALTCAAVVVASGLISSWLRLPTLAALWESTYGRVLLLKLGLVAFVVILGALNWRRVLPTLGDERGARRITRTASAELSIAALVLAVTAVLVSISPPERQPAPVAIGVRR